MPAAALASSFVDGLMVVRTQLWFIGPQAFPDSSGGGGRVQRMQFCITCSVGKLTCNTKVPKQY
jgi:hypothetical protein